MAKGDVFDETSRREVAFATLDAIGDSIRRGDVAAREMELDRVIDDRRGGVEECLARRWIRDRNALCIDCIESRCVVARCVLEIAHGSMRTGALEQRIGEKYAQIVLLEVIRRPACIDERRMRIAADA